MGIQLLVRGDWPVNEKGEIYSGFVSIETAKMDFPR
jgi:hypothetical protein